MGNDNAKYEKANRMFRQTNPNLFEITRRLPDNKEVRIKKIYHVNRPDIDPPPEPVIVQPVVVVKKPDPIIVVKKQMPNDQQQQQASSLSLSLSSSSSSFSASSSSSSSSTSPIMSMSKKGLLAPPLDLPSYLSMNVKNQGRVVIRHFYDSVNPKLRKPNTHAISPT